jgi:hypothetical protein
MQGSVYRWGVMIVVNGCALLGMTHANVVEDALIQNTFQQARVDPTLRAMLYSTTDHVRFNPLTGRPEYLSRRMVSNYCAQQGGLRRLECQQLLPYLYNARD